MSVLRFGRVRSRRSKIHSSQPKCIIQRVSNLLINDFPYNLGKEILLIIYEGLTYKRKKCAQEKEQGLILPS